MHHAVPSKSFTSRRATAPYAPLTAPLKLQPGFNQVCGQAWPNVPRLPSGAEIKPSGGTCFGFEIFTEALWVVPRAIYSEQNGHGTITSTKLVRVHQLHAYIFKPHYVTLGSSANRAFQSFRLLRYSPREVHSLQNACMYTPGYPRDDLSPSPTKSLSCASEQRIYASGDWQLNNPDRMPAWLRLEPTSGTGDAVIHAYVNSTLQQNMLEQYSFSISRAQQSDLDREAADQRRILTGDGIAQTSGTVKVFSRVRRPILALQPTSIETIAQPDKLAVSVRVVPGWVRWISPAR